MKTLMRGTPLLVLCMLLVGADRPATRSASAKRYVCAPCGMKCDAQVFDKPGTCPTCGLKLVEAASVGARGKSASPKVAFLIFDNVQTIDYTGPFEIFGSAGCDVYTVAVKRDPVETVFGMTVTPKYTFADAPQPDVLVVPGGGVQGPLESKATLDWIRKTSARTQVTMSVCNGAFILASAGLLDGLSATTTAKLIGELGRTYPKVKVVYDKRYVDNGKIITAGGLTSGMDGALHVVSRLLGDARAQRVALYEEYDWRDRDHYARAMMADLLIPDVDLDAVGAWELASTTGGTDHWEISVRGTSDRSASEILDHIGRGLETNGRWKRVATPNGGSSRWAFRGRSGEPWMGVLNVAALNGASHRYTATLTIARTGSKAG